MALDAGVDAGADADLSSRRLAEAVAARRNAIGASVRTTSGRLVLLGTGVLDLATANWPRATRPHSCRSEIVNSPFYEVNKGIVSTYCMTSFAPYPFELIFGSGTFIFIFIFIYLFVLFSGFSFSFFFFFFLFSFSFFFLKNSFFFFFFLGGGFLLFPSIAYSSFAVCPHVTAAC